jgi:hypothetical protein
VTGIGSLPMTNPQTAIRFVADASPLVPFWPQLPQRFHLEGVIEQGLGEIADLIEPRSGAYGYRAKPGSLNRLVSRLQNVPAALDETRAAGFFAFEEALAAGAFPRAVAIKGQIEGPITLAFHLFDGDRTFAHNPFLVDAVASHVARLALWQFERLRRAQLPVLLFIDEPGLCLASPSQLTAPGSDLIGALTRVIDATRWSGAVAGLHCCAAIPFAFLRRVNPDVFSFDAHRGMEAFFADPDARVFLRQAGNVAFGLVPTCSCLDGLTAENLFARWLQAGAGAMNLRELARQSMITATRGLGLLDEIAARASFDLASRLAVLVNKLALGT